jgi:hypothetical protein
MKYVLALDPGDTMTAVVLVDLEAERLEGRWYLPNMDVLELIPDLAIGKQPKKYLDSIPHGKKKIKADAKIREDIGISADKPYPVPEFMISEMIACYGMTAGKSLFETCVWIGRFIDAFCNAKKDKNAYSLMYRGEIKKNIAHVSKGGDAQVNAGLRERMGDKGTKKEPGPMYGMMNDLNAALCVALTFKDYLDEYERMQKTPRWKDVLKGNIKLNTFYRHLEGQDYNAPLGVKNLEWEDYINGED